MFGAGGNHGCFGDVYMAIMGKLLAILLFSDVDDEGYGGIDALVELVEVLVEVGLIDVAVALFYVVDDVLNFDVIEFRDGIVEFGVVDFIDGIGCKIDGNAAYVEHCLLML